MNALFSYLHGLPVLIEEEDGLIASLRLEVGVGEERTPLLLKAKSELGEYLAGERRDFDLPLKDAKTAFGMRLRGELSKVAYGETLHYGELALRLGQNGARGVASSLHVNDIAILVPCHRIIAKDGPGGYRYGGKIKKFLLELEKEHRYR